MFYPTVLLDKSAFESFSREEYGLFSAYFFFQVLPPVLLLEIIGDLTKHDPSASTPEALVQRLAAKFGGTGPAVHMHHAHLLRNDLLGSHFPMDGRMALQATYIVDDPVHGPGMVVGVSAMNETLARWGQGQYLAQDRKMAEQLREAKARVRRRSGRSREVKRMEDIGPLLAQVCADRDCAYDILEDLCACARLDEADRNSVLDRWQREGGELQRFAPYGLHIAKAMMALSLATELLPDKASNLIDLQYLYYLPFCDVFISNDRLHQRLAPLLLRDNQELLKGWVFKDDLKARLRDAAALDEAAAERRSFAFGVYPVPRRGSIITRLVLKYHGMWPGGGNSMTTLDAEGKVQAIKEARQAFARAGIEVVWPHAKAGLPRTDAGPATRDR